MKYLYSDFQFAFFTTAGLRNINLRKQRNDNHRQDGIKGSYQRYIERTKLYTGRNLT